jgi:hypothetical protein
MNALIGFLKYILNIYVNQPLIGGTLMAWSKHSDYSIHCDIVNPRRLELEATKEILAEFYGIQIWEVDDLIQQRIVDFRLMPSEIRHDTMINCSHFVL